jgi:DnaJ-class molecular chaperone
VPSYYVLHSMLTILPGDVRVIRGQGVLAPVSGERGDMFVKLSVKFPERVDPALALQLDAILPPRAPAKEFPHIIKFEDVEVEDLNADQRMRYKELGKISRAQGARFRRHQSDLLADVEVDLLSALGGGQLRIRHLDDRRVLVVNIPPGTVIRTGVCPRFTCSLIY